MACLLTWEDNGLTREFTNELNGNELLQCNITSLNDERFNNIEYVISDFTNVKTYNFTPMDTEVSVAMDKIISYSKHRLKVALVTTNADILNMVLQYCYYLKQDKFEYEVFPNMENAKKWCKPDTTSIN